MLSRLPLALALLLILRPELASAGSARSEATLAQSFPGVPVHARAGVVMDAKTGRILEAVNPNLRLPMASTTKVMTALLAITMGHLSDRITVPRAAFDYEWDATVMGLVPGQVVTLSDLLYGLLLPSGADAANTIAIHYGGSEAHFVQLMNAEAARLGLHDTHYVNAHGLTAAHHYTSAHDLAALGRRVLRIPALMKVVSTRHHWWNGHLLTNINTPLFWYRGVDGIKPGYTDDAGICQLLHASRHGRSAIVALLNTPNLEIDARNLLDFGLHDFTWDPSPLVGDGPALTETGYNRYGAWVYYVGSGHYVQGKFLTAFRNNGGLAVLGYPRTELLSEAKQQVQYFENGALAYDTRTGKMQRLALGLTALPSSSSTPTPTAKPTPPKEGTVVPAGSKTPTSTRPRPTATPRPTGGAGQLHPQATASMFLSFQRTHRGVLGSAVSHVWSTHGYAVQLFAYGALLYIPKTRVVLMLPIGDRLLASRHFLPRYPGNAYPAGFAPDWMLKLIGWE